MKLSKEDIIKIREQSNIIMKESEAVIKQLENAIKAHTINITQAKAILKVVK